MSLTLYNKKRKFEQTPEPKGTKQKKSSGLRFVVQKHDASHLHYDFRLEMEGVMKSWAVPKGPSMDPSIKRLAMPTEDHPISYNTFEGSIPEGNYGAGDVIVWDKGIYHSENTDERDESEKEFLRGLKSGKFKFIIEGEKLKGLFSLFRLGDQKGWMLVKGKDNYATSDDVTADPRSVLSGRMLIGRKEDTTKYKEKISKLKK
ncbi:MAG: ligase [Candidatus Nomurabacteria bacterium]|nr:ligase [Candidatus Nomurabacteria bacterium]